MSRILIVEDEGIIAKDLQRTLQRLGYEVPEPLAHGAAAVEAASRLHPDLVLMDIHLAGDMDGTEAAAAISEETDAAIVFLTAYADDETVRRAQESTPYGYLVKPFDDETLRTTIATALHRRHADLDQRRQMRIQREVLQRLEQPILLVEEDGTVRYANPAAQSLLGDVAGRPFPRIAAVADAADLWKSLRASTQPLAWVVAGRPTYASGHPIEDQIMVVLSHHEQRKAHEQAAMHAAEALRQRVRDLI